MPINYKDILLAEYRFPAVTAYNRLEPRPRDVNFDRSLRAEIRDAMWMLTRQWQTGEFIGDDAGSIAKIQLLTEDTSIDRISLNQQPPFNYEKNIPLETKVEREVIPVSFSLRRQMGSYFLKLVKAKFSDASFKTIKEAIVKKYNLENTYSDLSPEIQNEKGRIERERDSLLIYEAVKKRDSDGNKIHEEIISGDFQTWLNAEPTINAADKIEIQKVAEDFRLWFTRLYSQPENDNDKAWIPQQLEYKFSVSAPTENNQQITLTADQYYQGNLDWYAFDHIPELVLNGERIGNGEERSSVRELRAYLPAPVTFKGMPNPRFWEMEERQINFGAINASPTGLLNLLLAEFGLIYANDWIVIPHTTNINTISEIKGIIVKDVFGDRMHINSSNGGDDNSWQRWSMFSISNKNNLGSYNNLLFLPPSLVKFLESEPIEKVNFIRDEISNMVWAVEDTFPSQLGKGISGKEYAIAVDLVRLPILDSIAKIKYTLGTHVPSNWIPFIPVHIPGSVSEIQLQRAQMPDFESGGGIKPNGIILTEVKDKYFINEEEVPYSGAIVKRTFQRTRWLNGKTYLWLGRRKETGRGQGSSGLRFDIIEDIKIK
jgi:hypothetical protein